MANYPTTLKQASYIEARVASYVEAKAKTTYTKVAKEPTIGYNFDRTVELVNFIE